MDSGTRPDVEQLPEPEEMARTLQAAATPELAARRSLDYLQALIPVERATVLTFHEGEPRPRVLACVPEQEHANSVTMGASGGEPRGTTGAASGAIASVPLRARQQTIGTLSFMLRDSDSFQGERRRLCRQLGRLLGERLERLRRPNRADKPAEAAGAPAGSAPDPSALEHRVVLLQQENARLREANADLEAFAWAVSHDLRAPVRTIGASAAALGQLDLTSLPAQVRPHLQHIKETAGSIGKLIEDLHAYMRLERRQTWVVALSMEEVVDEALTQVQPELQRRGARVDVRRPLPEVMGHHSSLVHAVMNLLSNAVKFVAPERQPQVRIAGEHRGRWARVSVEDNGIGIPPGDIGRVFRISERLHGADCYPGSGVGLAIVHKAVTRLGGRVGADSTPGSGSCFWLELPSPAEPVG